MVWFPETGQLSRFMHGWKRRSSYEIGRWQERANFRYRAKMGTDDSIWQRKYYSFEIDNEAKLEEKLNDMHLNPVRAGFVEKTVDWKWSSARWYEQGRSVGVKLGWVE